MECIFQDVRQSRIIYLSAMWNSCSVFIFYPLFEAIDSHMEYLYKNYIAMSDDSSIKDDYTDEMAMM